MDKLNLLEDLFKKAKSLGATDCDGVVINSTDVSVAVRLGDIETIERAESDNLGLRVLVGKRQACVSTSKTDSASLNELVERAVSMAKVTPEDPYAILANKGEFATNIQDLDLFDNKTPNEEWLKEQALEAENSAREVKGITNSEGADSNYAASQIHLATSKGFSGKYNSSSFSVSTSVIAGIGEHKESDYEYSVSRHQEDLLDPKIIGKNAAEKTIKKLNSKRVKTKNMPIVFDPRVAKSLLANFASAVNGESISSDSSFLKNEMGKMVFNDTINIYSNPLIKRGLASQPFDGEGIEGSKLSLIENGILKNWVLDLRSAKKLNLKSNGHASRSTGSTPSPSCSNLYLENGNISPTELIRNVSDGIYITDTFGMGINTITGDYSQGASGFLIENGEITNSVSEFTIAGKLQEMFKNLTPANDLEFKYSINSPTILIEKMMVAGE